MTDQAYCDACEANVEVEGESPLGGYVVSLVLCPLHAAAERMLALLKELEWHDSDGGQCPICYEMQWRGHRYDCELAAVLKAVGEEKHA